jgi:hypothetical protein
MILSTAAIRRWRLDPQRRPRGIWSLTWHIGLPMILNLAWALILLVLLPKVIGYPLSFFVYIAPDLNQRYICINLGGCKDGVGAPGDPGDPAGKGIDRRWHSSQSVAKAHRQKC